MKRTIAYYRVSTQAQGRSGLGLEGQETAVTAYAQANGAEVIRAYTEIETGKRADRPELERALADCRRSKATLCVGKLDRLSRNTKFLLTLLEGGADVVFCDLPHIPPGAVGKFLLTSMASVSELEAGLISERTKAALAAYKARGGLLGSARPGAYRFTGGANAKAAKHAGESHSRRADRAYGDLVYAMVVLRKGGATQQEIANSLNAEGHTTRTGKPWNQVQVMRVLKRDLVIG